MPQQYKIDKVAEIESRIAENAGLFVVNYNTRLPSARRPAGSNERDQRKRR